jgi:hypothetical protein
MNHGWNASLLPFMGISSLIMVFSWILLLASQRYSALGARKEFFGVLFLIGMSVSLLLFTVFFFSEQLGCVSNKI